MNLVDGIAALAGSRCKSFQWSAEDRLVRFVITGPAAAMHDLITRSHDVASGHRLITKEVQMIGDGNVEIDLCYMVMSPEERR